MDLSGIEKRHGELASIRRAEEGQWLDLGKLLGEDDLSFDVSSGRDRTGDDAYDSSPQYALDAFVGGLFGEAVNPAERWCELTIQDSDLARWKPVQSWLWDTASTIYQSLSPAISSFYAEVSPAFASMGRYGLGCVYQEEWVGRQRIIDRALPVAEIFIDVDASGAIDTVHRTFMLTGRQMKQLWGTAAAEARDDSKYKIIHAVMQNPNPQPGAMTANGMPWLSAYVSPDLKSFHARSGYWELPYHFFQWSRRPGRVWPRGPGHVALADMKTGNAMERSHLIAAQFDAEPPIQTIDDTSLTAADILPNNILYGTLSESGKSLMQRFERGGKVAYSEQKAEQVRARIREAFQFSILNLMNRPQMTATEVLAFKEERLRQLGPNLVRIQAGLASFVARRYRILARANQLPPPPPEMGGHPLAVEFVSPLAKAQKSATGRSVLQWIGAVSQIAQATGDMSAMDAVDIDASTRVLHEAMVGLPDVIRDAGQIEEIRKMRMQQQMQQQGLEQAAVAADIQATVAHADQAQTLAKKRVTA